MKVKNIFFDFDGVIAESVSCKTEAFKEMYAKYGAKIVKQVENFHINNGGVSRFEKFKHWEKLFFGKDISESKVQEMANRFSNLVLEKVVQSNSVHGFEYFIEKYANSINFWIITGTPTKEIEIITKERKISSFFIGIHGSPENKRYWTEFLIEKFSLDRNETLFLGDASTDLDAALFSKLHFALRENKENMELFKNYKGSRFKDFYELEKKIKNNFIIK